MENEDAQSKEPEFYEVEKIVDMRIRSGKKYFYIKWVGYSSKDNTWEPTEHLFNVAYMVEEFEAKRKAKMQNKPKQGSTADTKSLNGPDRKRDLKSKDKDSVDFDDLNESRSLAHTHDSKANLTSALLVNGEQNREGDFTNDQPEKILGVVEQVSHKEFKMKVQWKKDARSGKRPKCSVHTNTVLKQICPDLLFDFYEGNIINTSL